MNKAALLAVLAAGLAAGAALGVFVPRWLGGPPATAPSAGALAAPARQTPVRVETALVREVPFARGIAAVGSLRSDEAVMLRPEVAGRIAAIGFQEGQPVARGQVLVRLDDAIPKAVLAQERANLVYAQSQYRRAVDLHGKGFVSRQALDDAASKLKVQEAATALAQARLAQMTVRAPFAGVAGLRNVSAGDYVAQGQDLAPLEAIDPLKVDFRVPEMYLSRIKAGQKLSLRLDALPGQEREGVVYAVSPLVDAGGRSILLRATVANQDASLRPGMFARVQLLFSQDKALVAPEAALSPSDQTQYVYVVRGGTARRVEVTIGERRDGKVEILTGVAAGDALVVAGLQRITDGAPVILAGGGS